SQDAKRGLVLSSLCEGSHLREERDDRLVHVLFQRQEDVSGGCILEACRDFLPFLLSPQRLVQAIQNAIEDRTQTEVRFGPELLPARGHLLELFVGQPREELRRTQRQQGQS